MAVTTKKTFTATSNSTTTTFGPIGIELNNQDDLDVYITESGGTRVLQLKQSTASTADANHPQVGDTTGLYWPAVSSGTSLKNYTISADNNNIIFNSALPSGAVVSCERRTRDGSSDYTAFSGGSTIRSTALNTAFDETRFTAQEGRNRSIVNEIDIDARLKKSGGTMTGDITFASSQTFDAAKLTGTLTPTDNTVTSAKIVDGSIVNADINASAAIANSKIAGLAASATTDTTNASNISSGQLAKERVETLNQDTTGNAATSTKLAATKTIGMTGDVTWTSAGFDGSGNVTGTAAIGSGVIVNDDIKSDAAIALTKLGTGTLPSGIAITSDNIAAGTVIAADIANDSITSTQIAANAIGASELADNAVDTAAIADDAVTTVKIADAQITAAKLLTTGTGKVELGSLAEVDTTTASPTDGQALVWDNTNTKWKPGTVGGAGSDATGTLKAIKNNDSQVGGSDIETLDFSSDFTVAENPDKEIQVSIAALVATNKRAFSQNYSIPSDSNGASVGPITVNSGYAVTVPANSTWLVH